MRSPAILIAVFAHIGLLVLGIITKEEQTHVATMTTAKAVLSTFIADGLECTNAREEKANITGVVNVIKADEFYIYEFLDIEHANNYMPKEGYKNICNYCFVGNIHLYVWRQDQDETKAYFESFLNFMN